MFPPRLSAVLSSHMFCDQQGMRSIIALFLLAVVLAQSSTAQEIIPPDGQPQPGGFLQAGLPGQNYYGNNVTIRSAYLPSGAQKSWIDYETVLPAGSLEYFYIYVHNVTSVTKQTEFTRLQIWRPVDISRYEYELVWEIRVEVAYNLPIGALYTYKNDATFQVAAGDRIGWTFEGSRGLISFQYVEEHKTYFRKVDNTDYPKVQQKYVFDNIHLPSIFSVAVQIDQNINECADNNGGCSDACVDTPERFYCTCPKGYHLDASQKTCEDIDECGTENGGCDHNCTNQLGGYECDCFTGFIKVEITNCIECWSQFELHITKASGLSNTCKRVAVKERLTLEECFREACRLGANVINQRPEVCDIRLCNNTANLDYTADKGGWDVHALPDVIRFQAAPTTEQTSSTTTEQEKIDKAKEKSVTLILAIVIPLVVLIIIAVIVGILLCRKRMISNNQNNQEDRKNAKYENAAFEPQAVGATSKSVDDVEYEEIPGDSVMGGGEYEGLDRDTRDNTEAPYDAVL